MKIFYSWQSDLPNNTNRGFINTALDKVARSINAELESADREIEIDTATKGVVGTVNISDTILRKIDECDVFVADISIVGKIDSFNKENRKLRRKTPNPNVLFELGYAWKKLGENRVITVMNTQFGTYENLPFDLRGKTIICYSIEKEVQEKSIERKKLEGQLEGSIRAIIKKIGDSKEIKAMAVPVKTQLTESSENENNHFQNVIESKAKLDEQIGKEIQEFLASHWSPASTFGEIAKNFPHYRTYQLRIVIDKLVEEQELFEFKDGDQVTYSSTYIRPFDLRL